MKFKKKKKKNVAGYFSTLTGPIEPKEKLFNNSVDFNKLEKNAQADGSVGEVASVGIGESLQEKKSRFTSEELDKFIHDNYEVLKRLGGR